MRVMFEVLSLTKLPHVYFVLSEVFCHIYETDAIPDL